MNAGRWRLAFVGVCAVASVPATLQAQTPLGGEFQVNTYTTGNQNSSRSAVAVAPNGSFVVVWNGPGDGSGSGIFGQRYSSKGTPIGGEFQVNTYTTKSQRGASIAMAPNGGFVVAWTGYGDGGTGSYYTYGGYTYAVGGYGIFARRFAANGKPLGSDFQVNTYTTYYQAGPTVAVDSSGDFVVAWTSGYYGPYGQDPNSQDGSAQGVFGRRFAADGTPLGSDFQVNTFTLDPQLAHSVASAANGDFVVVWTSNGYGIAGQDGSYGGVFGQRFDKAGTPVDGEFQINTYTSGNQTQARVASRPNGDFVVVWWGGYFQDGNYRGIFGQQFDAQGAPKGGEFQANVYTTGQQQSPAVALDRNGDFVVTWTSAPAPASATSQDGNFAGVFGRRFKASGKAAGGEFQVNTYTTENQQNSSVAARPNGDFVVVWQSRQRGGVQPPVPPSQAQDGDNGGIFARRYRR